MLFFTEVEKSTLKFIWENKRSQTPKAILSKTNRHHNTGLQIHYRAIVTCMVLVTDTKTSGTQ
jgi:hypothetical protein